MKRKIIMISLLALMGVSLAGCGKDKNAKEVALITEDGNEESKGYDQALWEGIKEYSTAHELTYEAYKTSTDTEEGREETISQAIDKGAQIILVHGDSFEQTIAIMQSKHKKVKFVLFDGTLKDEKDKETELNTNTCTVSFSVEEAGFLAGYAAVSDGYRQLGFIGGEQSEENISYGSGFVQGAEYAANELALGSGEVTIQYTYAGIDKLSPAIMGTAQTWYTAETPTEVIFGSGNLVDKGILEAAKNQENKKVIAAGEDKSQQSELYLTSAMKDFNGAVSSVLEQYQNDEFPEAKKLTLGAQDKGVKLPMDTSTFQTFNQTQYDTVFGKLADKTIQVQKTDPANGLTMDTSLVTIDVG